MKGLKMELQPTVCSGKGYPMEVRLIDAPEYPEQLIAFTYLECIDDKNYVQLPNIPIQDAIAITQHVLAGGHTPALESIHLTFAIRNISRILSHQIVRQRVGVSIGQRTQRANSEEFLGNFYTHKHYVMPPTIDKLTDENTGICDDIYDYLEEAERIYNMLIDNGIHQDEARYLIPHCASTSMTLTISYKSLMHLCSTRLCHIMQAEHVELAKALRTATFNWNRFLGEQLKPICQITGNCNRNENNPNDNNPKGVCELTVNGIVPVRDVKTTIDLTKYSQDNSK